MSDAWEQKRKAAEESYFEKKEAEAIKNARAHGVTPIRKSPITGEAMESFVVEGVAVHRCPTSGGIWLDKGELDLILQHAKAKADSGHHTWIGDLLTSVIKVK